jgi:transposase
MPQVQLPIFPAGSVEINRELACRVEGEQVIYFNGHLPVFSHAKSDLASFRLFTSQLIVAGSATQGHVAKAFGVPLVAIKRATKLYRERGPAGFYVSARRREGSKLNAEKLEQAHALLVQGHPLPVVSAQTGVLSDTLRKAISAGRLPAVKKTATHSIGPSQGKAASVASRRWRSLKRGLGSVAGKSGQGCAM